MMQDVHLSVILHDIRSSENIGSIFRTADAAAVSKIYLTGYTPTPVDRFKRKNVKVSKAALGAEDTVLWEAREDIFELIKSLQKNGTRVVAVEQSPTSISYIDLRPTGSLAFIFGNEVNGIPADILEKCDVTVEVPMYGLKESLNVSVSVGIVLFHYRNC